LGDNFGLLESGSTDPIESGSNPDPHPEHCLIVQYQKTHPFGVTVILLEYLPVPVQIILFFISSQSAPTTVVAPTLPGQQQLVPRPPIGQRIVAPRPPIGQLVVARPPIGQLSLTRPGQTLLVRASLAQPSRPAGTGNGLLARPALAGTAVLARPVLAGTVLSRPVLSAAAPISSSTSPVVAAAVPATIPNTGTVPYSACYGYGT
jgi:hypothetical protein